MVITVTVESVLLFGSEAGTLMSTLLKKLRIVSENVHWTINIKNGILYRQLERLSSKIRRRSLEFAGHCIHRNYEVVSDHMKSTWFIYKNTGKWYWSTGQRFTSWNDESGSFEVNICSGNQGKESRNKQLTKLQIWYSMNSPSKYKL